MTNIICYILSLLQSTHFALEVCMLKNFPELFPSPFTVLTSITEVSEHIWTRRSRPRVEVTNCSQSVLLFHC